MGLRVVNPRRLAGIVGVAVAIAVLFVAVLWPRSGDNSVDVASVAEPTTTASVSTSTTLDTVSSASEPTSTTGHNRTTTTTKGKAASTTPTSQPHCGTWSYSFPQSPNPNYPSGQISVFLGGSTALTGHPVIFEMTYSTHASGPSTADPEVTTSSSNGLQSFKARLSVGASSQGETFTVRARAKDASIACTSPPFPAKYYAPEPTAAPSTYPPMTQAPDATTTTTTTTTPES